MSEVRMRSSSQSKARLRLWLALLKTSRAIEGEVRERLRARHASTLPRFDVLAALDRYPEGLRMSALSSELRVSNGNVTGIVERLVDEGLAVRETVKDDRRAAIVRLTEAGSSRFAEMAVAHEGWIDSMLGLVDAEEAEALIRRFSTLPDRRALS